MILDTLPPALKARILDRRHTCVEARSLRVAGRHLLASVVEIEAETMQIEIKLLADQYVRLGLMPVGAYA